MSGVRRREFMSLLAGAAAAWPRVARAQEQAAPVIGFLNGGSPELFSPYVNAFLLGLNEAGFGDGRNCAIAYRWARGRYDELPALAAELVNLRVAVIAASGRTAVVAAKAATSVIPIIFLIGGDPVRMGLVAGFHRPGGNASGVTILNLALDLQRLRLLREALARTASIAVLFNPNFPRAQGRMREVQEAARVMVQDLAITPAANEGEIDQAFAKFDGRRPDALLVVGDPFFNARRDQIVALAARYAIPAIYDRRDFAAAHTRVVKAPRADLTPFPLRPLFPTVAPERISGANILSILKSWNLTASQPQSAAASTKAMARARSRP